MSRYRNGLLAAVVFALSAPSALAQTAYTIQGLGTNQNTYPQVMNDAGDTAGSHSPNGQQRAFAFVGGVFSDIGTLGGTYAYATAINASGKVVGASYLAGNSVQHAFLFDGTLHDLGTFSGSGYSYASAINAAGQVVGNAEGYAFRYSGGSLQKLIDLLPAGSGWSSLYDAVAINDAGQIIGQGYHNSLGYRPYLFTPASGSSPASIVTFGDGNTYARWINASGQVAGQQWTGSYNAFLFTPGSGGGTFTVIPSLGGTYTYPYDLNDLGQVVGQSRTAGDSTSHAFVYSNGQTTDIGTTGGSNYSYATGINNSGVVIGYSSGPFVYANGVMRQLYNLGNGCNWSLYDARALNNAGQIAGYGYDPTFGQRGFVMTPVTGQPATTLTVSPVYGSYKGNVQIQARLTAACSSLAGDTVAFSLNGTAKGTAQTRDDGWAILSTNLGNISAGSYSDGVGASFAGNGEFQAANASAFLNVSQVSPNVVWNPSAIVEGTPIGPDQLNATADTPGTFSYYYPGAGTVPGAGLRTLYATFYPTDTTNYYAIGVQGLLAVRASNPLRSFTARDVGGLGGTYTEATGFNNSGQATGYSYLAGNSSQHAFLFSNGVMTDIGTLGGAHSYGTGISDSGAVTGWSYTTLNNAQHAFLYSNGTMTDLDVAVHGSSGYGYSVGTAINASGDVALYGNAPSGYYHAFLYSGGTATDLGSLSGGYESYPLAINSSRQVVGYSYTSSCYHAFVATTSGMQDLGTLGGSCSQATGINDNGDVIGWAHDASNQQRAFLYSNGTMTDLGTLGGSYATAVAINESGVVTGWSYTAGNQALHGFRYANGVMTDLGAINYQSRGSDINAAGDIVGWSYAVEGNQTGIVHSDGVMTDLNALINVGETAGVNEARFINNQGKILARGYSNNTTRWYVLTPTTLASSSLALTASPGVYGGTTTLTATLTVAHPAGAQVRFTLNGNQMGTAFADAQGVARLENLSLGTLSAGTHTAGAGAVFSGDAATAGSTAAADVVVARATPTITWNNPAGIAYGVALGGVQLNAAASVGGSFAYSPGSGTVLEVGDNQVLSVTFTPTDSTNYTTATKTVSINVNKASQTIAFGGLSNKTYGDAPFALTATAPGGAVTFAVTASSIGCSLNGNTVTLTGATGAGQQCTIVASQAGGPHYEAAPDVAGSFTIAKGAQTITFAALGNKTFGDADFAVTASASSGLAVAFAAVSGPCTVSGSSVHITGAGSCTVRASQGGDANYNAASNVDRPFTIAQGAQTIDFAALANKSVGDPPFAVSATASSGLPVSFTASGSCTVAGATVTLTGANACSITASQGGNVNVGPAASVTRTFYITYSWSNVLQPINLDGTSIFKVGSTVPVKFKLSGASVGVGVDARIFVSKVSSGVAGTELEAIATNAPDSGNGFRYDAGADQYIFNWGTKGLSEGTWQIRIDLQDGAPARTVLVSLKR